MAVVQMGRKRKEGKGRGSVQPRGPQSGGRFAWAVQHLCSPYQIHLAPLYPFDHLILRHLPPSFTKLFSFYRSSPRSFGPLSSTYSYVHIGSLTMCRILAFLVRISLPLSSFFCSVPLIRHVPFETSCSLSVYPFPLALLAIAPRSSSRAYTLLTVINPYSLNISTRPR